MSIEKELRELVSKKGLRQTARELGIDSGSLYRSILDGSNVGLDRIRAILNLYGYELKIIKRKEVKRKEQRNANQKQRK
jgi:DNA-binding phage protein